MKKIVALLLIAAMLLMCMPGLAENTKHERVFVVSTSDGSVQSITDSVRLENTDGLKELKDSTMLENIQNVGGKETFTLSGETLTFEAGGNDITYQGTSTKAPAVLPHVSLTLDGRDVTFQELKTLTGDAVLTVTYETASEIPTLAVSVLPLPGEGISDVRVENALILSEMGRQVLVGYGLPGVDASLKLPSSFTATFHAEKADLDWLMTFATSDPIDAVLREADGRIDMDLHAELDDVTSLLTAMERGGELPEVQGRTREIASKVNELNNGLSQLNDGAQALADGTAQLSSGAEALKDGTSQLRTGATQLSLGTVVLANGISSAKDGAVALDTGLATLTENSDQLVAGAQTIFDAILQTANQQLAAAGLDAAGIEVPELAAENYADILDEIIDELDPDSLKAAAMAQVEAAVREKVQASAEQVRTAVEAAVQGKVLEAVLKAAGQDMTAEEYTKALENGMVPEEQAALVSGALQQQMASEEIRGQIEEQVQLQLEQLVKDNTQAYLASDETIPQKLEAAAQARESLAALKEQLEQISTFVAGVQAYTGGVSQAADGATQLHRGLQQLVAGATTLKDGVSTLSSGAAELDDGAQALCDGAVQLKDGAETLRQDGTQQLKDTLLQAQKDIAGQLLPYVTDDLPEVLRIYEETRDSAKLSGYDLRPEGMKAVTVYIIRTDLK
ncbi:MAG: hypothetical protein IJ083_06530 [Clostridia bacterium]|nr:hypothetical protein [Clostridia bacterium]